MNKPKLQPWKNESGQPQQQNKYNKFQPLILAHINTIKNSAKKCTII